MYMPMLNEIELLEEEYAPFKLILVFCCIGCFVFDKYYTSQGS